MENKTIKENKYLGTKISGVSNRCDSISFQFNSLIDSLERKNEIDICCKIKEDERLIRIANDKIFRVALIDSILCYLKIQSTPKSTKDIGLYVDRSTVSLGRILVAMFRDGLLIRQEIKGLAHWSFLEKN